MKLSNLDKIADMRGDDFLDVLEKFLKEHDVFLEEDPDVFIEDINQLNQLQWYEVKEILEQYKEYAEECKLDEDEDKGWRDIIEHDYD